MQAKAVAKQNRACAFCGALESISNHQVCAVCDKYFCGKHGVGNSVRDPHLVPVIMNQRMK